MENFFTDNWGELLIAFMAFLKVVVNVTPTEKDNKVFGWLDTLVDVLFPNKKKDGTYHS